MKYRAHIAPSTDSEVITIFDVLDRLKSDPKGYEKRIYYSLWYLSPMFAKPRAKTPHFVFRTKADRHPNEPVGGESIEHATTKNLIYKNKYLNLKWAGKEGIVRFSEIAMEHPFGEGEHKGEYRADLYAKLESDENNVLELKDGDWIAIEIHKSNKATVYKEAYYRKENIAAIEITYYDAIQFDGSSERLDKRIAGWLKIPLYFKRLHNPYYKSLYKKNSPILANNTIEKEVMPPLVENVPTNPQYSSIPEPIVEYEMNIISDSPINENKPVPKLSILRRVLRLLGIKLP